MANESSPPFQSFAGGFFSGRVMSEMREMAEQTWYQIQSVDAGSAGTGATIGASQTGQATGYQIQAAITLFGTVTPGVTGNGNTPTAAAVLPQTSRPDPLAGLLLYIANVGANPINLYPHPNDPSNSINLLAANTPVILGVNTITAMQCITPGVWQADGIGAGFMGSIETIVSQGNITGGGSSQGTATPITQAMANVSSSGAAPAGVTLPPAKAGAQIAIANNSGNTIQVYGNGSDTINGTAGSTGVTQASPLVTLYMAMTNGAWLTK